MKQFKIAIFAAVMSLASAKALASDAAIFVACYGPTSELGLSFDKAETQFTYVYQKNGSMVSFESTPDSGWALKHSTVTTEVSSNVVHLKSQIISGDFENPSIDASVDVTLVKDASGSFVLSSGSVYHLNQAYSLQEFIGLSCYVQ